MHIYTNEVTDWVIAADRADADSVLCEHYASARDEPLTRDQLVREGLEVTGDWPDDKPLTITDDDGTKTTLLPAEWIAREGRGFLCSTEF